MRRASDAYGAPSMRALVLFVALLVAMASTPRAGAQVLAPGEPAASEQDAPSSIAGLRSRIASLEERAERAGVTELLDHARHALAEADRKRALGDDAAASRAEAIADAALRVAERRIDAHRARADREAARARLAAAEARAEAARQALERARVEQARLQRDESAASSAAEDAAAETEE